MADAEARERAEHLITLADGGKSLSGFRARQLLKDGVEVARQLLEALNRIEQLEALDAAKDRVIQRLIREQNETETPVRAFRRALNPKEADE